MTDISRKDFLKRATFAGLGMSVLPSLLTSCEKDDDFTPNFTGETLIIGAGSAGMMAAYTLAQYGGNFRVLEAGTTFGGRVKKAQNFTSFPIDLGAEWIHTDPDIFAELINDENKEGSVNLIGYNPQSIKSWTNGRLRNDSIASFFYQEYKFKNTTWFDFFEDFIVPSIGNRITYNSPVNIIDYSGNRITVAVDGGQTYEADRIIITVPIAILQNDSITFTPDLPANQQNAISSFHMPGGLKVFIEFNEKFYPDLVLVGSVYSSSNPEERIYYDAAFKKESGKNILALFAAGDGAEKFNNLTEQETIDEVMKELDEIFDGKASQNYVQHIVQNWAQEPHIQGSYSFGEASEDDVNLLRTGLESRLFFAGEALHPEESSTVHGAGLSGVEMAKKILLSG